MDVLNAFMVFIIKNVKVLRACKAVSHKVNYLMKKRFDSEPVHVDKCMKSKVKSYNDKINTNFNDSDILDNGVHYVCLSVTLVDSVVKMSRNCHPKLFLEECKYVVKEKKDD